MANGTGLRGVQSRWDDGDLVFETLAGVEALRIGSDGVVSIAGIAFPTTAGTNGQVLKANASGDLIFAADETGA
jgi:hypothetical protein